MKQLPLATAGLLVRSKAGDPTTSDIPNTSTAQVWLNTSTNTVKLWVNKNGTLVSVALT